MAVGRRAHQLAEDTRALIVRHRAQEPGGRLGVQDPEQLRAPAEFRLVQDADGEVERQRQQGPGGRRRVEAVQ